MDWLEPAGRIIEGIGTESFASILAQSLHDTLPYEFTVIFGYAGHARPLDLFDDFTPKRRILHVEEYQEGPYLLDPFFLASLGPRDPGLWRLREIAPDRFYQGEYYRNYYAQTGLAEEIGFLIKINRKLNIVISLMRTEKRFSNTEMRTLKKLWPVIDAACRKNWRGLGLEETGDSSTMERRIEYAFNSIGEGVLTPREREVVELTLRGHSADAIGKMLGISSGTVRIHRKNIYSKLRISSQGELFSEFITAILGSSPLQSAATQPPG